jgi:hypothetical protein
MKITNTLSQKTVMDTTQRCRIRRSGRPIILQWSRTQFSAETTTFCLKQAFWRLTDQMHYITTVTVVSAVNDELTVAKSTKLNSWSVRITIAFERPTVNGLMLAHQTSEQVSIHRKKLQQDYWQFRLLRRRTIATSEKFPPLGRLTVDVLDEWACGS